MFGRRTTPNAAIVELNASVTGILPILRRLGGAGITLETRLDPAAGSVRIDPGQLEQAILNLVVNARDAMPSGGVITVQTSRREPGPGSIAGVGACAELLVHDTGAGMTPELAARIFEPFFTTKATGAGTGLGLAILHGIVKDAGGDVSVESAPGRGTTIGFTLPLVTTDAAPVVDPPEVPGHGTETILVVEDEDAIRTLASRMLGDHGYRVESARDAAAAREIWSIRGAVIDVLVSDVTLPGTTGLDLATELLRKRPDLRVVLMSGFIPEDPDSPGLPAGTWFLPKPFTLEALLRAVRRAIDGEAAIPAPGGASPAP